MNDVYYVYSYLVAAAGAEALHGELWRRQRRDRGETGTEERDRDAERQRDRDAERQRDRDAERQRHRDTEADRDTEAERGREIQKRQSEVGTLYRNECTATASGQP